MKHCIGISEADCLNLIISNKQKLSNSIKTKYKISYQQSLALEYTSSSEVRQGSTPTIAAPIGGGGHIKPSVEGSGNID